MKRFIVFLIVASFFLCFFIFASGKIFNIVDSSYYAVFLSNGQVYFGHLQHLDQNTIELADVYYLKMNTDLNNEALQEKKNQINLHLALIKLGQEIHGPTSQIFINRQQVLFWEKLRENGQVVKAIKSHE
jgi:hypothetical protein